VSTAVGIVAPGIDRELLTAAAAAAAYEPIAVSALDSSVAAVVVHLFADARDRWLAAARDAGCPVVLCCAPSADASIPSQGHTERSSPDEVVHLVADAYVWREHFLAAALHHVLGEDRASRAQGPARLVFLGHGGADHTRSRRAPPIGATFDIGADPTLIGRGTQSKVTIGFSTAVARHHARVTREPSGGVVVDCLASTNGTYVRGVRIDGSTSLQVGDEVAISGFLRLRLDGSV